MSQSRLLRLLSPSGDPTQSHEPAGEMHEHLGTEHTHRFAGARDVGRAARTVEIPLFLLTQSYRSQVSLWVMSPGNRITETLAT